MLVEYKPNVKWGIWVGLFLQVSCGSLLAWRIYRAPDQDAAIADPTNLVTNLVIALVLLGGIYCWALGCGDYARGKGHAGSVGSLLRLLSLLGLFILWMLPDRHPFDAFGPRRLAPTAAPVGVSAPPPVPGADPAGSRVNPLGVRAAAAGHCLEIHLQQGNAMLTVPQNAPDACLDASGMVGLYARTAAAQPRAPG